MIHSYLPHRGLGLLATRGERGLGSDARMVNETYTRVVQQLRRSLALTYSARAGLTELAAARLAATVPNWDGHGGAPLNIFAYGQAKRFLYELPTTAPPP